MWAKSCHLLCELWDGGHVVGVLTSRGERGEGGNEEVEAREGCHVNCQLPKVCVQLKTKKRRKKFIALSVKKDGRKWLKYLAFDKFLYSNPSNRLKFRPTSLN